MVRMRRRPLCFYHALYSMEYSHRDAFVVFPSRAAHAIARARNSHARAQRHIYIKQISNRPFFVGTRTLYTARVHLASVMGSAYSSQQAKKKTVQIRARTSFCQASIGLRLPGVQFGYPSAGSGVIVRREE